MNASVFESILDQVNMNDVIGNSANTLVNQHQKDLDENLSDDEPTVDDYKYVLRIMTINVSKRYDQSVEDVVQKVLEYTTEVIFRLEEFLATSPRVKRHSKLYFYRQPDLYRIPEDIEAMVTRPRSFSSSASDYLDIVFGLDYNIRNPRDLFMLTSMLHKFVWFSSYFIEYKGNSIAAKDKVCHIDRVIPLYNMLMKENGIEKWKTTDSYNESVESFIDNAFSFFGESVEICQTVRNMFQYNPIDKLMNEALSYRSYGSKRKCDTPKFLLNAIENNYIDADYLCNEQFVTFRITSASKSSSFQNATWRLKFIWEHVEKSLKSNPRKITDYIMRIYDRNYIRFVFYLGTFQGVYQEDLDFDLKTTVNDVCVILEGRWERNEIWDVLAGILGIPDGFPQDDVVKFMKKLDKQIYGK